MHTELYTNNRILSNERYAELWRETMRQIETRHSIIAREIHVRGLYNGSYINKIAHSIKYFVASMYYGDEPLMSETE